MLPILWLPSARDDLRQIVAYIAKENPPAARRLKIRIETSVLSLTEHPICTHRAKEFQVFVR